MNLTVLLAAAGAAAGVAARTLLARLRRGASVHSGWCIGAVAVLWALAGWRTETGHLPWWWLPIPLVVAWFAVTLTVVDLKHRRLPNVLTLSAYPATAATTALAATQSGLHVAYGALLGAALLGAIYLALHLLRPAAMGGGDVKLSGSQGAVLGAVGLPAVLVGTTLAALLTLALHAAAPRRHRAAWRTGIPHGPALLAATYVIATFPALSP
ncbi:prepilin peptidase [Actinophytocola sp. NPDC049390]|uniref:prepilin peptidase n=1 Tax=Actinophytocola sp. NPDC049390 TaxID=3363894 RepID=UPI0037A405A1